MIMYCIFPFQWWIYKMKWFLSRTFTRNSWRKNHKRSEIWKLNFHKNNQCKSKHGQMTCNPCSYANFELNMEIENQIFCRKCQKYEKEMCSLKWNSCLTIDLKMWMTNLMSHHWITFKQEIRTKTDKELSERKIYFRIQTTFWNCYFECCHKMVIEKKRVECIAIKNKY